MANYYATARSKAKTVRRCWTNQTRPSPFSIRDMRHIVNLSLQREQ